MMTLRAEAPAFQPPPPGLGALCTAGLDDDEPPGLGEPTAAPPGCDLADCDRATCATSPLSPWSSSTAAPAESPRNRLWTWDSMDAAGGAPMEQWISPWTSPTFTWDMKDQDFYGDGSEFMCSGLEESFEPFDMHQHCVDFMLPDAWNWAHDAAAPGCGGAGFQYGALAGQFDVELSEQMADDTCVNDAMLEFTLDLSHLQTSVATLFNQEQDSSSVAGSVGSESTAATPTKLRALSEVFSMPATPLNAAEHCLPPPGLEEYATKIVTPMAQDLAGRATEATAQAAAPNELSGAAVPKETADMPDPPPLPARVRRTTPVAPMSDSDCTTTLTLKNIPKKYTRDALVARIAESGFRGEFDFLYMPIDLKDKNKCNMGHAIVNFRTGDACARFTTAFQGDGAVAILGDKVAKRCAAAAAPVQGQEANVHRLQQSSLLMSLLADKPGCLPSLFDEDGEPVPFPQRG